MKRIKFEDFKPKKIIEEIKKIDSNEEKRFDSWKLENYIEKILKGSLLKEIKLRKLLLSIEEIDGIVMKNGIRDEFLKKLFFQISKIEFGNHEKWISSIKVVQFHYFENFMVKQEFLKKLNNLKINVQGYSNMEVYNSIVSDLSIFDYYLTRLNRLIENEKNDIEEILSKFDIRNTTRFYNVLYKEIIKKMVIKSLENNKWEINNIIETIERNFSDNEKREVFRLILNYYIERNINFKSYNKRWFLLIEKYNGKFNKNTWKSYTDEEKNIFKKWYNYKNITEFFKRHDGYNDERREYWAEWTEKIEDNAEIKSFDDAFLLQFKDHLIIEFGKIGAVRVFETNVISIQGVRDLFNCNSKTAAKRLMDEDYEEYGVNISYKHNNGRKDRSEWYHQGDWQFKFDKNMKKMGY